MSSTCGLTVLSCCLQVPVSTPARLALATDPHQSIERSLHDLLLMQYYWLSNITLLCIALLRLSGGVPAVSSSKTVWASSYVFTKLQTGRHIGRPKRHHCAQSNISLRLSGERQLAPLYPSQGTLGFQADKLVCSAVHRAPGQGKRPGPGRPAAARRPQTGRAFCVRAAGWLVYA